MLADFECSAEDLGREDSRERDRGKGGGKREKEGEWMEKVPGLEADVLDGPRRISGEVYLKRTRFTLGLQTINEQKVNSERKGTR